MNSCQLEYVLRPRFSFPQRFANFVDSAQSHQKIFMKNAEQAYGALQDYLKSKGMKTTGELLDEVISTLPQAEQEKIRAVSLGDSLRSFNDCTCSTCSLLTTSLPAASRTGTKKGLRMLYATFGPCQIPTLRISR